MLHDVIRYGCRGVVSPQKENKQTKKKKTYPSPDSRQHSESDFFIVYGMEPLQKIRASQLWW